MSRQPNDLEVRYGNKVVGWLMHHDGSQQKGKLLRLEIARATEWGGGFGEPHIEAHAFKLISMNFKIDALEIAKSGPHEIRERIARSTASYANCHRDASTDSTIYKWPAVKLADFDEYEWIFDHHCFVPADSPPDFDTQSESKMSGSSDRVFGKSPSLTITDYTDEITSAMWEPKFPLKSPELDDLVKYQAWPLESSWGIPIRKTDKLLTGIFTA